MIGTGTAETLKASTFVGGWCRVSMTWTSTGGLTSINMLVAEADNDATFNGLDQDSLYIWGAQLVDNTDGEIVGPGIYHSTSVANKPRHDLVDAGAPGLTNTSLQGADRNRIQARSLDGAADSYSKAHHASMNINDGDHVYTFLVARTDAGGTNIRALFSHGSNNADGLYIPQTYSTGKWEAVYSKAADTAVASVTDSASSSRWHVLQLIRTSDLAVPVPITHDDRS